VSKLVKVQQPDYRNNGKLQFVTGWTGGGAEMCIHLTFEEYEQDLRNQAGPGRLVFVPKGDAVKSDLHDHQLGEFWWEPADK